MEYNLIFQIRLAVLLPIQQDAMSVSYLFLGIDVPDGIQIEPRTLQISPEGIHLGCCRQVCSALAPTQMTITNVWEYLEGDFHLQQLQREDEEQPDTACGEVKSQP